MKRRKINNDKCCGSPGILKEAFELSHAIGKLKICSDEEFESAK